MKTEIIIDGHKVIVHNSECLEEVCILHDLTPRQIIEDIIYKRGTKIEI